MSTKKIIVNQNLLHSTTKKNKPAIKPDTSNSALKHRLLKRIKEHKQMKPVPENKDGGPELNDFDKSVDYLNLIQQKNKTMKNYDAVKEPVVFLDLPEELMNPATPVDRLPIVLKDVPYGNLKHGTKPLYRDWTRKNRDVEPAEKTNNLITSGAATSVATTCDTMPINNTLTTSNATTINNAIPKPIDSPITRKRTTYRTIKRKHTLGKSEKNRSVGILLKDKTAKNRIIDAQKALKHEAMIDVKQYLRDHNLITTNCGAPNDVLRTLYESVKMAGEITNCNKKTLLEKFT